MFAFLLSGAVAFALGPIPPSGQVEAGKAEREFEKTVPRPIRLARLNELQAGQSLARNGALALVSLRYRVKLFQ
jgi:hypothetical protein